MIIHGILLNLSIAAGTLFILWLIYLWNRNPSIVDLGWAVGLTLTGLGHNLILGPLTLSRAVVSMLVFIWGARLGVYLFWTRIRKGKKDPRYESLSEKSTLPAPLFFLLHYLVQACFQAAVGFVFIFTAKTGTFENIWPKAGVILWSLGFAGSITVDYQLNRFRGNPSNKGKLCKNGLWNYTRHPNYFFEIVLWTGFAFIGFGAPMGYLSLVSPLVLFATMRFITGPISERQSLKSKPAAYSEYRNTTSMIIPWFKKQLN
jgi:steroid 5-alpha reductase family enzyme